MEESCLTPPIKDRAKVTRSYVAFQPDPDIGRYSIIWGMLELRLGFRPRQRSKQ